jgi:phytoene synthase
VKEITIKKARLIEQQYGSNYYLATLFLPQTIKEAVFVLYAFVRIPDELVDNPKPGTDPKTELIAWQQAWEHCYLHNQSDNEIMLATREVFKTYNIPFALSEEFINAMIQDLTTDRYQTYPKLQTYIRGSAEVVGIMLVHIFECTDTKAIAPAMKLGEAMQLTNFLRDVGEDYTKRGRIYLPLADLEKFIVNEHVLNTANVSPEFKKLMKYYILKAHSLFAEANLGIALLPKNTRRAVRLASAFYEGLLDRIEDNNYDVLTKKAKHSFLQKCRIICNEYV